MILTKANSNYLEGIYTQKYPRSDEDIKITFKFNYSGSTTCRVMMLANTGGFTIENIVDIGGGVYQGNLAYNGVNFTNILLTEDTFYSIRFTREYKDNSKYNVTIYDDTGLIGLSLDSYSTYGTSPKVVLGSSWTTPAIGPFEDIEVTYLRMGEEVWDLKQKRLDPSDNLMDTYVPLKDNNTATINGSDIPAMRADAWDDAANGVIPDYFSTIAVVSEGMPVIGASVTIGATTVVTDESGLAVFSLPVGNYTYTISATNFATQTNIPLAIDVNGINIIAELVLDAATSDVSISRGIEGTDDTITSVVGDIMKKPNRKVLANSGDGLQPISSFTGDKVISVPSIAKLRELELQGIDIEVKTRSYWGEDNANAMYNNCGGGSTYKVVSIDAAADSYYDDGGGTIVSSAGNAFQLSILEREVDASQFGAIGKVRFKNEKNPSTQNPITDGVPDCTPSIRAALAWLHRRSDNDKNIEQGRLVMRGHFFVNPSASGIELDGAQGQWVFNVDRGIEVWMEGASSCHSNYDGIVWRVNNSYNQSHRYNNYFKMWAGTERYWWVIEGDTEPNNKHSIPVLVQNGRKSKFHIETWGFKKGIDIYGKGEGCVENSFYLGDIRNCQYGLHLHNDGGGWAHQNHFYGGRIKLDGLNSVSATIPTPTIDSGVESAAIMTEGDSCTYNGINLEGAAGTYEYTIKELKGGRSLYNGCRFELSTAGGSIAMQIGSTIIEGYSYNPTGVAGFGDYSTRYIKGNYDTFADLPAVETSLIGVSYRVEDAAETTANLWDNNVSIGAWVAGEATLTFPNNFDIKVGQSLKLLDDSTDDVKEMIVEVISISDPTCVVSSAVTGDEIIDPIANLSVRHTHSYYSTDQVSYTKNRGPGTKELVKFPTQPLQRATSRIGAGEMTLGGSPGVPTSRSDATLTLGLDTDPDYNHYLQWGLNRDKIKGMIGKFGDFLIHTLPNDFVDLIQHDKDLGFFKQVVWEPDTYYNPTDWVYHTDGKWYYKNGTSSSGSISMDDDIANSRFLVKPASGYPTLLGGGSVSSALGFYGITSALVKTAVRLPYGLSDNHKYNETVSNIIITADSLSEDVSQKSSYVFIDNNDSSPHYLGFDLGTTTQLGGKEMIVYNNASSQVLLRGNGADGVKTLNGLTCTLEEDDWILLKLVRTTNTNPAWQEITRKQKKGVVFGTNELYNATVIDLDNTSGVYYGFDSEHLDEAQVTSFTLGALVPGGRAFVRITGDTIPTIAGDASYTPERGVFNENSINIMEVEYDGYYAHYWFTSHGNFQATRFNDFSLNTDGLGGWNGGGMTVVVDAGEAKISSNTGLTKPEIYVNHDWKNGRYYRVTVTITKHDSVVIPNPTFSWGDGYVSEGTISGTIDTATTPLPQTISYITQYHGQNKLRGNYIRATSIDTDKSFWLDDLRVEEILPPNTKKAKVVSDATYTVLETDSKLTFDNAAGCTVTLPVTVNTGQEISYFNYCGVGQNVVFQDDATSSIIQDSLLTLEYGKYAGSEVIEDNVWSLTGDLI